jgi:hypothetical protein
MPISEAWYHATMAKRAWMLRFIGIPATWDVVRKPWNKLDKEVQDALIEQWATNPP